MKKPAYFRGRRLPVHKYVIMGPQGSGKGTQAKLLCRDYDLVHISVGDIFRWHAGHKTKLGAKVQRYVKSGRLVPDELVDDVVKERLDIHDWRYGFVLDGFPRNAAQAEFFLENYDIDAVVVLELPEEAAIARMQSRRLCSGCGLDYNLLQLRPRVPEVCDNCGGRLLARADDTPEAIRTRLRDYREKTQPILDLLQEKGVIVRVDATPPPDVVQAEMRHRLGLVPATTEEPEAAGVGGTPRR
jgi:adenylate kinase